MIYIKRILFIIVAILIFLLACIAFLISALVMPLYVCAYYVKYGSLQDVAILPAFVIVFFDRFINKINPD